MTEPPAAVPSSLWCGCVLTPSSRASCLVPRQLSMQRSSLEGADPPAPAPAPAPALPANDAFTPLERALTEAARSSVSKK
jgi:hypothetical protein